ncbi:uncharacterized protein BDR25DRAFT_67703 [Lindgomyces ingoldianus]|uniref:Uncharacterized protein n=1 Tax=Lindgomyces ingoldianus TaxID=673940 RepID=A0ACB6RBT0_9PLEO|nr:uncharacterized protein BDR25DRAFT_67703 [Lindgomyces ingoldianus]KAF2476606.1 hypothetical protein BDR25DRAFT_67703 [Lindgomyces ingoldianus]
MEVYQYPYYLRTVSEEERSCMLSLGCPLLVVTCLGLVAWTMRTSQTFRTGSSDHLSPDMDLIFRILRRVTSFKKKKSLDSHACLVVNNVTSEASPRPTPHDAHAIQPVRQSPQASSTSLHTESSTKNSILCSLPYEILELILLYLPPKDLLLSQRVCRRIKEIIILSKPIRRCLFLEPSHQSGRIATWKLLKWNPFLEDLSILLEIRVIGVHRSLEGPVRMIAHVRIRKTPPADARRLEALLHDEANWRDMLVTQPPATFLMHPSASLFWKSLIEDQAQFSYQASGVRIVDIIS